MLISLSVVHTFLKYGLSEKKNHYAAPDSNFKQCMVCVPQREPEYLICTLCVHIKYLPECHYAKGAKKTSVCACIFSS